MSSPVDGGWLLWLKPVLAGDCASATKPRALGAAQKEMVGGGLEGETAQSGVTRMLHWKSHTQPVPHPSKRAHVTPCAWHLAMWTRARTKPTHKRHNETIPFIYQFQCGPIAPNQKGSNAIIDKNPRRDAVRAAIQSLSVHHSKSNEHE